LKGLEKVEKVERLEKVEKVGCSLSKRLEKVGNGWKEVANGRVAKGLGVWVLGQQRKPSG